jgi:hypothetical protein
VAGWHDGPVVLTVQVPGWQIEGDGRVFAVDHEISGWLTFDEDRSGRDAVEIQSMEGIARPLPDWPGRELGRHPVRIDVAGAALYWDAPSPAVGAVHVTGRISANNVDAPDGLPETVGVVRRVRMLWHDYVAGADRPRLDGEDPTYEDVDSTYVPPLPEFERRVPLARRLRGEGFRAALKGPASLPTPPDTVERHVAGALIDLEITGIVDPAR